MGSGRGATMSTGRGASRGSRPPAGDARRLTASENRGDSAGPSSVGSEDAAVVTGGVAGVPVRHLRVRSIGGGRDGPSSTDSSHGGDLPAHRPRHRMRGSRESLGGDSALSEDTHTVRSGFYLPPPRRCRRGGHAVTTSVPVRSVQCTWVSTRIPGSCSR